MSANLPPLSVGTASGRPDTLAGPLAMTEIMDQARRESFEQDQERYRKILESQKAQREAQMDDLRPLPERHALCSLRLLPTLFRFAALAILFVGLLLTIRAVTDTTLYLLLLETLGVLRRRHITWSTAFRGITRASLLSGRCINVDP